MRTTTDEQAPAARWWLSAGVGVGALVTWGLIVLGRSLGGGGLSPAAYEPPRFVDETSGAGVAHVYAGEFPYFVGGGVAVFDCNDDLRPDLYLAGGANPAGLYRNDSDRGGSLRFARLADPATDLEAVVGAYPLDVDGDGVTDLIVLRNGENIALRGLGGCRFERANETWNLPGGGELTAGFSATWEGSEALPTLAFGNYVNLNQAGRAEGCDDHVLVRPQGELYGAPASLSPGWCTLSALFSDWSRSGRRDLRMTNDRHYYRDGEEQMWRVAPGEPVRMFGEEDGWQTVRIWGMGIASYDLTGDGLPEVYLTSQSDNKLQTLVDGASEPRYQDIAFVRGVTAHRPYAGDVNLPSTAWHVDFQDVNHDGYIDLYVAKGNVEAMPDFAMRDPNNLMLGQPDGTFLEAGPEAGITTFTSTRGAAVADLNLDGMLDLVEVNRRQPVALWRNVGWGSAAAPQPMGNWLMVKLTQPAPNRDAIGSWIQVKAGGRLFEREVNVGGGHAGGQLGGIHFGLGSTDNVQLRVQWPDGEWGPWYRAAPNQYLVLARGSEPVPAGP
jgi:hypothetical protein